MRSVWGPWKTTLISSSLSLLQREFSLVPELVWAGELRVCDQSTVNSSEPCCADLGSQPAAVSWAAVAVGWRSDSQGCAHHHHHHHHRMTTPTSPVPCPKLIPDPRRIHHERIITSQAATCCHTFTWDAAQSVEEMTFKMLWRVIGDKAGAPACAPPWRSDSYLACSANVAPWRWWQRALVSPIDVGHQCLGMMRDLWLMI